MTDPLADLLAKLDAERLDPPALLEAETVPLCDLLADLPPIDQHERGYMMTDVITGTADTVAAAVAGLTPDQLRAVAVRLRAVADSLDSSPLAEVADDLDAQANSEQTM